MSKDTCMYCLGDGVIGDKTAPYPCTKCNGLGYVEQVDPIACSCGNHKLQVYHTVLDGWVIYCPECGFNVSGNIDKNSAVEYWNLKNQ